MKTTVFEWIMTLPEPYRSEAIHNTPRENASRPAYSITEALYCAFIWGKTTQGDQYWRDLFNKTSPNFIKVITEYENLINMSELSRLLGMKRTTFLDHMKDERKHTPDLNAKIAVVFGRLQHMMEQVNSVIDE